MVASLVITLREGIEAALIIGILIAYLVRTGNSNQMGKIWWGTGLAVIASLLGGAAIFIVVGEFEGTVEQLFEGLTMVIAVAVLSYMVIWMKHQAANIKGELQLRVDQALRTGSGFSLAVLAFVVVVREGLETALFMFAATRASSPLQSAAGGITGLVIAIVIGYLIYAGGSRINLRTFFNVTGGLLILVAAGLLGQAVHEFEEAGLLPVIIEHVWDTGSILSSDNGIGGFLRAIFGYNSNPSLTEIIAYLLYLGAAVWNFRSPGSTSQKAAMKPSPQGR